MKKLMGIVLGLGLVGLGACGGGGDVATGNKLRDKMCACTDQKCMDAVDAEAKDFGKTLEDKYKSPSDAPKELQESHDAYKKCRRDLRDKLESAGSGSGSAAPTP